MKFLIHKKQTANSPFKISHHIKDINTHNCIYFGESKDISEYSENNKRIFVIGDLVHFNESEVSFHLLYNAIISNRVHEFGGFFYLIYLRGNEVTVYSSLFNILPVYIYENENKILISSKLELIIDHLTKKPGINKKYILERVLFNYGLFNDTYFEGIKLLKSNHYLNISCNLQQVSQFKISDLYTDNYNKGKKVLNNLACYFIDITNHFLPNEKYALSFTGGFDGRTLLAVSRYYKRDFIAYSFGSEDSGDLILPKNQAHELDVLFEPIYLNDEYVKIHSYEAGRALIELTEGQASFARAHYVFAAKRLADMVHYMVAGNFGSELFRAMHNPGVVISKELAEVFKYNNKNIWIDSLINSPRLSFLQTGIFEKELDEVIEEIDQFKNSYKNLDQNQLFYIYALSEIFRKYFGPEINMQSNFIVNRSPFLNFHFIKQLFQTYYCGVYSDFFMDNPVKRFKGQVLYAHIIKHAFPGLLTYYTIKGYKPSALLRNFSKPELLYSFIKKKISLSKNNKSDYFSVQRAFNNNKEKWLSVPILAEYYNKNYIQKSVSLFYDQDMVYNILSSNFFLNKYLYGS